MKSIEFLLYIGMFIIFHGVFLAPQQLYDNKFNHLYYGIILIPGILLIGARFIIRELAFSKTSSLEPIICYTMLAISLFAYFRLLLSYYRESEMKLLISLANTVLVTLCGTIAGMTSSKYSVIIWISFFFVRFYDIVLWIRDYDKRVEKEEQEI